MTDLRQKTRFLIQKRTAWNLLTTFFIFDNFVSYWAIKYMHAREGNRLIAPILEKYPILYFPVIPLTIVLMFFIIKILVFFAERILKKWRLQKQEIERVILEGSVIYWAIANSSGNLVYLLGFRIHNIWLITTLTAVPMILAYIAFILYKIFPKKT